MFRGLGFGFRVSGHTIQGLHVSVIKRKSMMMMVSGDLVEVVEVVARGLLPLLRARRRLCVAGSYFRLIDSCISQLKAQGPSRTCDESKEQEEASPRPPPPVPSLCLSIRCILGDIRLWVGDPSASSCVVSLPP